MAVKKTFNIILASGSPRRKELLAHAGFQFEIIVPQILEKRKKGETPRQYVTRLSREKALAALEKIEFSEGIIIFAADTIVVSNRGEVLEKPKNAKDAFRILKKIIGTSHHVLTGFSVCTSKKIKTKVISTQVKMRKISDEQMRNYILTGEPMDKAGAYAAQGIGMGLVSDIRGSYTNVVGLPIAELIEIYEREF